jgi:hypothetical protein
MLRVTLRGSSVPAITLGSGETLLFGRSPVVPAAEPRIQLRHHALALPHCAPHISRLLGELAVGEDVVRLRWRGTTEAQLSSLFDAPGGARRVTLVKGMSALLDEGENHIVVLRGWSTGPDLYADIVLSVDVAQATPAEPAAEHATEHAAEHAADEPNTDEDLSDPDGAATGPAPTLEPRSREWYVALALAEPWLTGADDYPRPPSNREIYERVLGWHGYAWNLSRPQRVDDALRAIARIAFGPHDDPFAAPSGGRMQNVRYAVGRRAAEVRLVTVEDLDLIERGARAREPRTR